MKQRMIEVLATGLYSGKSPWAPGTMGTIVAIPLVILMSQLSPYLYMLAAIVLFMVAVIVSQFYETAKGEHDCQEIVIDEIIGYVVAMTWLPMTWQSLLAGFVLFRLLDALKPFPINLFDEKIDGGLGVVADDVVAGIITNIILQVVFVKTAWLGLQWVDNGLL